MRAEFSSSDPNADTVRQRVVSDAVDRFFASIEFDLEGTILRANQNFLNALEYDLAEIVGEKHRLFVDKDYGQSQAYKEFWDGLRSGMEMQGQFPRVTKSGSTIWIQATYAPVLDEAGKVVKVIKIASDVTARRVAVDKLSEGLVAMSRGDFKHRVSIAEDNELFALSERFNSTLEHLSSFLDVVNNVATGLESASTQMEQRSDQAAKTALQNAATFEETSAEVDMVSESIDTSSRSVKEAQLNTDEAAQLADVSATSMANALDATIAMRKATTEMSGINEVIDSIAFQTNLLALNAGIEAARAGPSGAGFAVVATEIRSLAGRSQDASSRIQALISRSVQQAKTTENYVQESESNLRNVKNKSRDVADTMVSLSQETKEQSERVGMINRTIRELAVGGEKDAQLASENQEVSSGLGGFSKQLLEELKSLSK